MHRNPTFSSDFRASAAQVFSVFREGSTQQAQLVLPCCSAGHWLIVAAYQRRSSGAGSFFSSTKFCPQGNSATVCCTNSESGHASTNARMYLILRGETLFMAGKAARRSWASGHSPSRSRRLLSKAYHKYPAILNGLSMSEIKIGELPQEALLNQYKQTGEYADCYFTDVPRRVTTNKY